MEWVLGLERCNHVDDSERLYYTEYEFCSEARIPGVLDYENGAIRCHILEEADRDGLFTYLVRVRCVSEEYKIDGDRYSKRGYYFEEGFIGDLLAIFSVFSRLVFS